MALGVPKFPDVGKDEDVIKSIDRSKGSLYNKVDIVPNNNKAKPYLLKEVIRRHIIKGGPSGDESKISNWKIKQTILWLKNNPPAEIEFDLILEFWESLKMKIKNHYFDHYGSLKVNTLVMPSEAH